MSHETPKQHEGDDKKAEKATFADLNEALVAVNTEVLFSRVENFRNPVTIYGRRMVDDRGAQRELPLVDDQPTLHTPEVSGAEIISRLQQAEGLNEKQRAAAETLSIGPDQHVALAFATECFERNPASDEFVFAPAAAFLIVRTEYPGDNNETTAFSVSQNRLVEGPDQYARTWRSNLTEMHSRPSPEDKPLRVSIDAADIALHKMVDTAPTPVRVEIDESQARQVGEAVADARHLSHDEVQAMSVVAAHFRGER